MSLVAILAQSQALLHHRHPAPRAMAVGSARPFPPRELSWNGHKSQTAPSHQHASSPLWNSRSWTGWTSYDRPCDWVQAADQTHVPTSHHAWNHRSHYDSHRPPLHSSPASRPYRDLWTSSPATYTSPESTGNQLPDEQPPTATPLAPTVQHTHTANRLDQALALLLGPPPKASHPISGSHAFTTSSLTTGLFFHTVPTTSSPPFCRLRSLPHSTL